MKSVSFCWRKNEIPLNRETKMDYESQNHKLLRSMCGNQKREDLKVPIYVWFSISIIPAASEIVEGKRTKKTVERLDIQAPKPKEKLKFGDGNMLTCSPRVDLTTLRPPNITRW